MGPIGWDSATGQPIAGPPLFSALAERYAGFWQLRFFHTPLDVLSALVILATLLAIRYGKFSPAKRSLLIAAPMMLAAFTAFFTLLDGYHVIAYQYALSKAVIPPLIASVRGTLLLGMIGSLIGLLLSFVMPPLSRHAPH